VPSLTKVFCNFSDIYNNDGVGVDWRRGRGEGKDYGVQINSHFGIVVFNNQQMLQAAMEVGGG
jgi:hypothetical protein